jgi:hypothetical protein
MVAYYRNRRFAAEHGTGYEGKVCAVCDDLGYVGCFCGRFVPYPRRSSIRRGRRAAKPTGSRSRP